MSTLSSISYANLLYSSNQGASGASDVISQAIDTAKEKAVSQQATATKASNVSISDAALAAAAKADNKKEFSILANEVRAALNAQYAKDKSAELDLTDLSGRALAAIALNEGNQFSPAERAAAKLELRERQRADFMAATASGDLLSAVQAYSSNLVSQFDAMSEEERQARGWNSDVRANAADFVKNSKTNLFDQLEANNPNSW